MLNKLKPFVLLTIIICGGSVNAEQPQVNMKIDEALHGMQVNINLKTLKERHFGDMCNLTFLKVLGSEYLVDVHPGITAPRALSGASRFMKVKQVNRNTLIGMGSEQHYQGEGPGIIIKKYSDKIIITLDENNAPTGYELTSENNVDQVRCEDLLNVGI